MPKKKKRRPRPPLSLDMGKAERPIFVTDAEVKQDLAGVSRLTNPTKKTRSRSSKLSAGDPDATAEQTASGEETVGGSAPTPDQNVVEEIGEAVGITYEDTEPLDIEEKRSKRDRRRWELNPASSEDFEDRNREKS